MIEQVENSPWRAVNAILVINLKHRTDRWERVVKMLSEHGVEDKVIRVDAVDGTTLPGYGRRPWFRKNSSDQLLRMKAGAAGCCFSHRKAIQTARDKGFGRILILEDDAILAATATAERMSFVGDFLMSEPDLDMFYLGFYQKHCYFQSLRKQQIDGEDFNIWRIRGPLMLHAVVIDKRIYDSLLSGLPTERNIWAWMTYWGSIDAWIQNWFGRNPAVKICGCRPNLIVQQANYSDICGRILSVEESEGTHRPMHLREIESAQIKSLWPLSFWERTYQFYKRGQRLVRAFLFGYHKT